MGLSYPYLLFAYWELPQASTGFYPFELGWEAGGWPAGHSQVVMGSQQEVHRECGVVCTRHTGEAGQDVKISRETSERGCDFGGFNDLALCDHFECGLRSKPVQ